MTTIISSKGQLVLPAEYRQMDGVRAGESFEVERLEAGHYLLKHQKPTTNQGVVDWLAACPESDWFAPIPSESTELL